MCRFSSAEKFNEVYLRLLRLTWSKYLKSNTPNVQVTVNV